ncbi:uncharacterized protein LOC113343426 [Papaver somniferum]|uniref:uncharacterized protein LOC113283730 n=1 Tax=Papaver somniferum TaxID=3469 RepID=UPI000E6FAE1D|nr:uncharacterized protein LOC113283730 [Papaver somniferum]XP_026430817.1 uncharacterized protein LOC113327915 [Papaver somniferum]XP_026443393.1 uncharacterized protein LOC113343426 [Papaver somniferum]
MENYYHQTGPTAPAASQADTLSVPVGLPAKPQQKDNKCDTKTIVRDDRFSRGLDNLDISGPLKPILWRILELIYVHHREKREKAVHTNGCNVYNSFVKAMGSCSGMGCAGASSSSLSFYRRLYRTTRIKSLITPTNKTPLFLYDIVLKEL